MQITKIIKFRFNALIYDIKCHFFPHNIIKLHSLEKSWSDRPEIMFHALFQIIVDFVELEQPFISWNDQSKFNCKRFTDVKFMRKYIDSSISIEELQSHYYNGCSTKDKIAINKSVIKKYHVNTEILDLYEWYKNEKYNLDLVKLHAMTGEDITFNTNGIEYIPNNTVALITWDELAEIQHEHEIMCDIMLKRILNVRRYLWT